MTRGEIMENSYSKFDDKDKASFREWLNEHLKHGPIYVTFLKKDGTTREMHCTLSESRVKSYEKKTDRTKAVNEDVCAVFDLDKQEWRSFRYDAITRVRFELAA
jgi:uncharacterized protein with gpF-like domain